MNLAVRTILPLTAFALAAPAQAQALRIPTDGLPAIEVAKQNGWTENYDDSGNLILFANDGSGAVLFRVVTGPSGEKMPPNDQLAAIVLAAAGAKPFTSRSATTFAGGPAEMFSATMQQGDGPVFDLQVVIRNVNPQSIAVAVKMMPQPAGAAGKAKVEAQYGQAKIVTR